MLRKLGLFLLLIICSFSATACNHKSELVGELSEEEAQRICVLLQRNGLQAVKEKVGAEDASYWVVKVETPMIVGDQAVAAAQYILEENDLPRSKKNPLKEAFPNGGSLIPTPTEEQLRKLSATQESIELTLEKITGVVSAQVHVVLPNPNPLVAAQDQVKASASVLLKYNTKEPPLSIDEVRSLVAPSVEGLAVNSVQVVMKAVPEPDVAKFDNIKNKIIKIIGLAGVAMVGILVVSLVFCFIRMRKLSDKIAQLERSATRAVAKKEQPVPVANAAAR